MRYEIVSNNGFHVLVGALKGEQFRTIKRTKDKTLKRLSRTTGSVNYSGLNIIGGLILFILAVAIIHKQITKKKKVLQTS